MRKARVPHPKTPGQREAQTSVNTRNLLVRAIPAVLVFVTAFLFVHQVSQFRISLDEGIYFCGAERILSGQHLYRDFFALTGPGTFWLLSLWFKLFSNTLAAPGRRMPLSDLRSTG